MSRLPALLLVTAALVAVGCAPSTELASAQAASGTQGAFPLPDITLIELDGGEPWSTSELAGAPAVINVWATWCVYCVEEMPAIESVHVKLGDRVVFVGVDRADDATRARELAARTGVTYHLVADPDSTFFAAVGARAMPTTLFVDADGTVVHTHPGPLDAATLEQLIATHLGE